MACEGYAAKQATTEPTKRLSSLPSIPKCTRYTDITATDKKFPTSMAQRRSFVAICNPRKLMFQDLGKRCDGQWILAQNADENDVDQSR
jgi:hypothetical protein